MIPSDPKPGLAAGLLALLVLAAIPVTPGHADPRSVEDIIAALHSEVAPPAAEEARAFDARLMATGEFDGIHVRNVTDRRLDRVGRMAERLLRSAGQDPAEWTVRVLDTDPALVNACVIGGRYVYVFTGLLAQNPAEDELAFILAHDLGHTLLAHEERRGKDLSTSPAAVAGFPALLPTGHETNPIAGEPIPVPSAFRPADEQEADALGTCIARRAGYDPVRGAGYFTSLERDRHTRESERAGRLAQARREVDLAVAACEKGREQFRNAARDVPRNELAAMTAGCRDADSRQQNYNRLAVAYSTERWKERRIVLLSAHPQESSRMAAITGVVDVLSGRKDVATLVNHEPAHRVLVALQQVGSDLAGTRDSAHD